MRSLGAFALVLVFTSVAAAQTSPKPPLEFPVACSETAHARFIQGIIKLHNSAYDEAAVHFRAAEQLDPNCAMAYWGEAMSFNHPFWGEQDMAGGRRALSKLAPTSAARIAKISSARERGYLNAVEALYGDGDKDSRDFAYAAAMQKLAFENPQDFEAAAFYAAAILGTIRITDSDSSKRTTAASILTAILAKYPNHPGALHYLIHAYDTPELAPMALDAARRYEKVADENFHALHMPSHTYVQLGMWSDVARCNDAAFQASDRYVQRNKLSVSKRDYHSLEWLQYAEMQLGQYKKARSRVDIVLTAAKQAALPAMNGLAAEMASRFAVDTGQWDILAPYPAGSKSAKLLFAQGLAAARKADLTTARGAAGALDALIQQYRAGGERVRPAQTDILKRELEAEIALREKRFSDAERLGSEAAHLEADLEIPSLLEQNGLLKPAEEFLGDLLLAEDKPAEAAEHFTATLQRMPKRSMSILGLARARAKQGDLPAAVKAYRELLENWANADPTIPALLEAKAFLQKQGGE